MGAILALPSILALFFTPYQTAAILGLVLASLLIGGSFAVAWIIGLPPWTIIESRTTLTIHRTDGGLATWTKIIKARPNHQGQTQFIHRNIRAEGGVNNFRLDGTPSPYTHFLGEYIVHEGFGRQVVMWRVIESRLSYDLHNSFMNPQEYIFIQPDFFTRKATVEIYLPQGRPVTGIPEAYCEIGAETRPMGHPVPSDDGLRISWEARRLKPGYRYFIRWNW